MLNEKKPVFLLNNSEEALKLKELLSIALGIEIELENCDAGNIISVLPEYYQSTLEVGFKISNLMGYDMSRVNGDVEEKLKGHMCIMYGSLPKTRQDTILCETDNVAKWPIDIRRYIEKLEEALDGRSIKVEYDGSDRTIEFMVSGLLEEYERVRRGCEYFVKGYDNDMGSSPFIQTLFFEKDGTLNKTKKEEGKKESRLKSYFNHSMFIGGLSSPEGHNIVPENYVEYDPQETGYLSELEGYDVREISIESVNTSDLSECIQGSFLVDEYRIYDKFLGSKMEKEIPCKDIPFTMIDSGDFKTEVSILDETTVSVTTEFDVARRVAGYNFDGRSVRDGIFPGLAHNDGRAEFVIQEYYKNISNCRLLHYADSSKYFEVYEVPIGWSLKDGIANLGRSKLFDAWDYDEQDPNIAQILEILKTRPNHRGTSLVKK